MQWVLLVKNLNWPSDATRMLLMMRSLGLDVGEMTMVTVYGQKPCFERTAGIHHRGYGGRYERIEWMEYFGVCWSCLERDCLCVKGLALLQQAWH